MIRLLKYSEDFEAETLRRIAEFFGFHQALIKEITEEERKKVSSEAAETLQDWQRGDNELYVILQNEETVGFLRLNYRGPIVAWIEDIFVDEDRRGQGIATAAISAAEDIVRGKAGYEAICLDVVPRNTAAMKLYHKLGFTDLSMLTLRKELNESKRDRPLELLGLKFKY